MRSGPRAHWYSEKLFDRSVSGVFRDWIFNLTQNDTVLPGILSVRFMMQRKEETAVPIRRYLNKWYT